MKSYGTSKGGLILLTTHGKRFNIPSNSKHNNQINKSIQRANDIKTI
jgi:hypothetical protein